MPQVAKAESHWACPAEKCEPVVRFGSSGPSALWCNVPEKHLD